MIDNGWIKCKDELPPEDGTYEVTNLPEWEEDPIKREYTSTAYYDGYGFQYLGVYRPCLFWRKYEKLEKKYGKQNAPTDRRDT
jgi:hypothetical protein